MKKYLVTCLIVFFVATTSIYPSEVVLADQPQEWIKSNLQPLIKLYVQLHQNPELSFEEKETAARIADELAAVGAEVTQNVGGHGVVAVLENGDGPTVMLRADLDALPVTEQTNVPYASTKKTVDGEGNTVGVMHACGHDVHMTNLIGVARYMAVNRELWSGRLMLIGQPAEERGSGAAAMINDGLYDKFGKPDFAIALHCNATMPSTSVGVRGGFVMANVDSVDVFIYGRGGHGAYPHTTIDPIVLSAKFILDVQTIVSREINPTEPAVITVGSIHAGTKHNIIPDECHLQLTVRSYSEAVRQQLLDAIRRKAKAAAAGAGAKEPVVTVSEGTPSLANDVELAERLAQVFRKQVGPENVLDTEPTMGGEDFSHFGRSGIPSLMYHLGVVDQRRLDRYQEMGITPPSLHSAGFYPDVEKCLETGFVTMSHAAMALMPKK